MGQSNTAAMNEIELETTLRRVLLGRVGDLQVELHGQELVLRGWTRSYHVKQLAQHAAMEASGLPIRANAIEVHWDRGQSLD
jgi:hypothetical protein